MQKKQILCQIPLKKHVVTVETAQWNPLGFFRDSLNQQGGSLPVIKVGLYPRVNRHKNG